MSSGPGAFAKIRACAHGSTVVDRAQGAIVLDRNFQRGNQRSAVSPANELAGGPLQSSSGRLAQHLSCPPRGGVSSEPRREGGIGVRAVASIQNPNYTFSNFNFHIFGKDSKMKNLSLLLAKRPFSRGQKFETFSTSFLRPRTPGSMMRRSKRGVRKNPTRGVTASLIRGCGGR